MKIDSWVIPDGEFGSGKSFVLQDGGIYRGLRVLRNVAWPCVESLLQALPEVLNGGKPIRFVVGPQLVQL